MCRDAAQWGYKGKHHIIISHGIFLRIFVRPFLLYSEKNKIIPRFLFQPHLRNLFFRTAALLSLNIYPVFVLDGDAPELKRTELINRRKAEGEIKPPSQDITQSTQTGNVYLERLIPVILE